jgi:hypothetical protein
MTTAKKISTKVPAKTPHKTTAKKVTNTATKVLPKTTSKFATAAKQVSKKMPNRTVASSVIAKPVGSKAILKAIVKPLKPKKVKLVRDSFTIPKPEYLVLDNLKLRAADLKYPVKKGELLRAGIKALAAMTDAQFLVSLKAVPLLKTGRPSK